MYMFVHHCNMCLYLSSVGVRRSSVTWADYSTSLFCGYTETATAPFTIIAAFFDSGRT